MTEDEADQVLSSAYPNETLVSYREIDDKIDAINDGLNKIEVSLQIYEELKNKPHCESPSPERIEQLHKTHQDFALTLVALKKRRAQYFRSIEN